MRVLAVVHKWPPLHNAGAEWMLHTMLRRLVEHGHEVTVNLVDAHLAPYWLDGELVVGNALGRDLGALVKAVDVVVTHLDRTQEAARAARAARRPIVHVVHNERQLAFHHVTPGDGSLVVFNSEWIAAAVPWAGDSIICRPPVRLADYELDRDPSTDTYTTLVNATPEKGSGLVRQLAARERARRFLFVRGAYGIQDLRRLPGNVTVADHSPRIRDDIYARTRVVLMPSSYETWGRVAIEAGASGIPCIAHPTDGLTEALGPAGIFADRRDPAAWARELRRLDDPAEYAAASSAARARAVELERVTDGDLDVWEAALESLVAAHPAPYHDAVTILSSLRRETKCPVCGAAACRCGATEVAGRLRSSRPVGIFEDAPKPRCPLKVYRTYEGDFRYRDGDAERAGLKESGPRLPRVIVDRAGHLTDEALEVFAARYAAATASARDAFLMDLAQAPRARWAETLDTLIETLPPASAAASGPETPTEPATAPTAAPTPASGDAPPVEGRMGDLLEWAGTDPDRLAQAIDAERSAKNRARLVAELEKRLSA